MPQHRILTAVGPPTSRPPAPSQPNLLDRPEFAVRPLRLAREVPVPIRIRRPCKEVGSAQQPDTAMVTTETMVVTPAPYTALQAGFGALGGSA